MQPSIEIGTVLQNRYRVLQVLGQGGFGRTYLAEDQRRFDEFCAIKEYIPPKSGAYNLQKSQELFQREASILYKIRHPQIPQFRELFEEERRLFLVQDYIEGKTYSLLLQERRDQGYTFSVEEVIQLLQQLLPVLTYLHDQNIIHRDISPDNIIQQRSDKLPILIDFGVVKAVATQLQTTLGEQGTTVGKPGYAPMEQIQTGNAYPSSDLYALAVTSVVLLTGRRPAELFDTTTAIWHWEQFSPTVSAPLAQTLNRMLCLRPSDRFQSAQEALNVLGKNAFQSGYVVLSPSPKRSAVKSTGSDPSRSQSQLSTGSGTSQGTRLAVPQPSSRSRVRESQPSLTWDNPWIIALLSIGIVSLAGVASWVTVRSFITSENVTPVPSATPRIDFEPLDPAPTQVFSGLPSPTATPTLEPQVYRQRLALAPGQTEILERNLTTYETLIYIIPAEVGQMLNAYISGEGVLMTILGPDDQPVSDRSERVSVWEGELPTSGDYSIELKTVEGLKDSDYTLELKLDPVSEPEPEVSPLFPLEPTYREENIIFLPGENLVTRTGRTSPARIARYRLQVEQDDQLGARILAGNARIRLYFPGGELVPNAFDVIQWQMEIPFSGRYFIDVVSEQETSFGLAISLDTPSPNPTPSITPSPQASPPPNPSPTLRPVQPDHENSGIPDVLIKPTEGINLEN